MSDAAASRPSGLRETSMTAAPASAKDWAIPKPIPLDPPVTTATFPSKLRSTTASVTSPPIRSNWPRVSVVGVAEG
jgi:hypothetical protein